MLPISIPLEFLFLLVCLFMIWTYFIFSRRKGIAGFIMEYAVYMSNNLRMPLAVWMMAIPLIWIGATLHLEYDESYTFLHFTNKTIAHSIATYPAPNNHVLHSILTNISWWMLGWTKSQLALRLPAIIFSLMTAAFIFHVFIKESTPLSYLIITLLLLSNSFFYQSFQARGYSMQSFFAVSGLASIICMQGFSTERRFTALMLTHILGLYTSPAYLYTALPLSAMFLASEYKWFIHSPGKALTVAATTTATIILLYSPIMLYEGTKALTENKFVKALDHISITDILDHTCKIIDNTVLTGIPGIAILLITFIYIIYQKKFGWLSIALVPLIMMLLLKQLPYLRVFQPIGTIIIVLFSTIITHYLKDRISFRRLTILTMIGFVSTIYFRLTHIRDNTNIPFAIYASQIEKQLSHENATYTWKLHWSFSESQHAYAIIKKREFIELEDTIQRFPNKGILLSSNRIVGLPCVDSIKSHIKPGLKALVYKLDASNKK